LFTFVALADKGLNSITFFILASYLTRGDYGKLDLTTTVMIGVAAVAGLELFQGVLRLFAGENSLDGRRALVSTAFWTALVLGLGLSSGLLIFWRPLASLLYGHWDQRMLVLGAFWMVAYSVASVLSVALRADLQARAVAISSAIKLTVQVALALWLVVGCGYHAEGLLFAQCAGLLAGNLWCALSLGGLLGFTWSATAFRRLFAFSAPLVVSSLCVVGAQQGDRLIVWALLSLDDVGLLTTGYRVANIVGLVTSGVMMALSPMIYQFHQEQGTPKEIARLFRVYLVGGFALCLVIGVMAGPALVWFVPAEYYPAARCIPFLTLALLAAQASCFFPGLALASRMKSFAAIQAGTLVLNLSLCWVWGRLFGLLGVCAAGVVVQTLSCIVYARLGHRHYPIPMEWKRLVPFLLSGGALLACWVYLDTPGWWPRVMFLLGGIVVVFASRAISVAEAVALWGQVLGQKRTHPTAA